MGRTDTSTTEGSEASMRDRTATARGTRLRARTWAVITPVAAVFVATYFFLGDLSTVHDREIADYVLRPRSWEPGRVPIGGWLAAAVAVGSGGVLISDAVRRRVARSTPPAVALLCVVAWYLAMLYRTATAAVIGANIGYGVSAFLGVPLVFFLSVAALWLLLSGRRSRH